MDALPPPSSGHNAAKVGDREPSPESSRPPQTIVEALEILKNSRLRGERYPLKFTVQQLATPTITLRDGNLRKRDLIKGALFSPSLQAKVKEHEEISHLPPSLRADLFGENWEQLGITPKSVALDRLQRMGLGDGSLDVDVSLMTNAEGIRRNHLHLSTKIPQGSNDIPLTWGPPSKQLVPTVSQSTIERSQEGHLEPTDGDLFLVKGENFQIAAANNYPKEDREGAIFCDDGRVTDLKVRGQAVKIVVVSDGSGVRMDAANAAEAANDRFIVELSRRLQYYPVKNGEELFYLMTECVAFAHQAILEGEVDERGNHGITTFSALVDVGGYLFHLSIGDCRFFVLHEEDQTITIKDGNQAARKLSANVSDPGGQLNHQRLGKIDFRNFSLNYLKKDPGMSYLLCTDGVADNFNPDQYGILSPHPFSEADWIQDTFHELKVMESLLAFQELKENKELNAIYQSKGSKETDIFDFLDKKYPNLQLTDPKYDQYRLKIDRLLEIDRDLYKKIGLPDTTIEERLRDLITSFFGAEFAKQPLTQIKDEIYDRIQEQKGKIQCESMAYVLAQARARGDDRPAGEILLRRSSDILQPSYDALTKGVAPKEIRRDHLHYPGKWDHATAITVKND